MKGGQAGEGAGGQKSMRERGEQGLPPNIQQW